MKTTKAMLIGSLCVLLPLAGHASLLSTVNTDTISNLDVGWTWNPETQGGDIPTLLNWSVSVFAVTNAGDWKLRLDVQHKANPHAGESSPSLTTKDYSFSVASGFGVVINDSFDVVHPSLGHIDSYSIVLDRSASPASTAMSLTAVHQIPEPSSIVLIGMTSGLLYFVRRLRL